MFFKKHGIELLEMYTFQTNTFDFKPFMTKIKALNPDGIGIGTCHEHGAKMAIEARQQGIKAPFIGGALSSIYWVTAHTLKCVKGVVQAKCGAGFVGNR